MTIALQTCAPVRFLSLSFTVSRDEEYVRVHAIQNACAFDLRERAHHYLLLLLARRRLEDIRDGLTEAAQGWLDPDEFAHDPSFAAPRINLHIFRIRAQFASLTVSDPDNIVERRRLTREFRIGTALLSIHTI